jgi:hypothetical protein
MKLDFIRNSRKILKLTSPWSDSADVASTFSLNRYKNPSLHPIGKHSPIGVLEAYVN